MTFPLYKCPSLRDVLPQWLFLQNLPSVVAGHVLNPLPGEIVLDMCAAPGVYFETIIFSILVLLRRATLIGLKRLDV